MTEIEEIDWLACELIEQIPGKVSGRPMCEALEFSPTPW